MSSAPTGSHQSLQETKRALLELLNDTQKQIAERQGMEGAMDIHHPERSPGWIPYRHQAYPKMLYHPAKLEPKREAQRLAVRRRNDSNPTYAPLDPPESLPLTMIVQNKEEEEQARTNGFVAQPPAVQNEEEFEQESNDPLSNPALVSATGLCGRGCGKAPHKGRCAHAQVSA